MNTTKKSTGRKHLGALKRIILTLRGDEAGKVDARLAELGLTGQQYITALIRQDLQSHTTLQTLDNKLDTIIDHLAIKPDKN